jgi:hypothetical protein
MGLNFKEKIINNNLVHYREKTLKKEEGLFTLAESLFTKGIQRSQYLTLDNDLLVDI